MATSELEIEERNVTTGQWVKVTVLQTTYVPWCDTAVVDEASVDVNPTSQFPTRCILAKAARAYRADDALHLYLTNVRTNPSPVGSRIDAYC